MVNIEKRLRDKINQVFFVNICYGYMFLAYIIGMVISKCCVEGSLLWSVLNLSSSEAQT